MGQVSSEEDISDRRNSEIFGKEPYCPTADEKREAYRILVRKHQDDARSIEFIDTFMGKVPRTEENSRWRVRLNLRLRLMKERLASVVDLKFAQLLRQPQERISNP